MRIVFWGTPQYSVKTFEAIIKAGHEIVAVVTQPDKRRGRGRKLTASPIKLKANEYGIDVFTPISIKKDKALQQYLDRIHADIYIVVAFGQILPKEVLEQPKYGCWNSHASLLPKWRGAGPIQWCIWNGDKYTGINIMSMEEGLDTGPVLIEKKIEIQLSDNAEILSSKLSDLSAEMIVEALEIINKNIRDNNKFNIDALNLKQQLDTGIEVSYARQISKDDNLINWENEALYIHRQIMALYPNAYTYLNGKRLKILSTIPIFEESNVAINNYEAFTVEKTAMREYRPGEVITIHESKGFIIGTGNGFLYVMEAQIEGKSKCKGESLIKQLKLTREEILGT